MGRPLACTLVEILAPTLTMSSLANNAIAKLNSIQPGVFKTDNERYEAKEAARRLLAQLESPFERGYALTFEPPIVTAGIQIFLDLGVWSKWTERHKQDPHTAMTLDDILAMCSAGLDYSILRESW